MTIAYCSERTSGKCGANGGTRPKLCRNNVRFHKTHINHIVKVIFEENLKY